MKIHLSTEKAYLYSLYAIALLLGFYTRISLVIQKDFPLNDGGLFWTMTHDLIQNHFILPRFTTYNQAQIPFAYPPGAFYLNGLLAQLFQVPLETLFRWIPLLFCLLSLLLVYPIALNLFESPRMAVLAMFAFASIQPSYSWLVMGGGVTRAPAYFFSMLAILFTLKASKLKEQRKWLLFSSVAMALAAYFHLEIAWTTAFILVFLYLYYDHSRRFFIFLVYHLLIGILLLLPYLFALVTYHGIQPMLNAFTSGNRDYMGSVGLLFIPNFTAEQSFPILAVLGALGGIACFARQDYLPLIWLFLVTLVDPRSVHRSASLPEALLIATALETFLFQGIAVWSQNLSGKKQQPRWHFLAGRSYFPVFAAALVLTYASILTNLEQNYMDPPHVLSTYEREAFTWIKEQTPPNATFLTLPAGTSWEEDWVSEWFPSLTQHKDTLTVQGYEWVDGAYGKRIRIYDDLVNCLDQNQPCFQAWQTRNNVTYDYILWPKRSKIVSSNQMNALGIRNECTLDFQNPEVEVYQCPQASIGYRK